MINSEIKCVNQQCTKKRYCALYNSKSGNVVRLSSENEFSPCVNFSCHEHDFIHIHGKKYRECANCELPEPEQKNVRHDHGGFIEWSFA